ncbi:MAG: saccharopine dehydrogenase NADP-binding domain-containing protein [Melioribacteraceae bacterium]|nr:saccharopine dehydrogenase NADP-binding domain-containing protein [Melioribacteraceae bacterium]MCF8355581.1 saccharopine dehydrogenase NADP-binding domain-containing protein [Melioribacteraceae bacterium]MCF8395040.1 saccharopine dehydrogenase NADP-binding domain-containing protein [Melioribacteraceae bacterium]MCF8420494.1 saccharopine dehydrogenase NADP-binding domain-containing protein [Melioribacteraceae bacterium]
MKALVLGVGLVGRPMILDLAKDNEFEVTAADINSANLEAIDKEIDVTKLQRDFSNKSQLIDLVSAHDVVISAVPGFMGFDTLKTIIETGKNVVDISFMPEDPFELDDLAVDKNVTAIVDCGVSPGMTNILIGQLNSILDEIDSVIIYVGGLPVTRELPFEYKAGFSPADVIEEYVRPARIIENGKVITRPALSEPELINFPGIGTLEAFNSDGLRTLAKTIKSPNMKEKTLRYPGHIEKVKLLREIGYFSHDEIEVNGKKIKPVDLSAKLLFPIWEMKNGDIDLTVLKIIVNGKKDGKKIVSEYNMLDYSDEQTGIHSMARTTGYTATMAVRMLAKGLYNGKGIIAPEFIGEDKACVDFIRNGLEERGVIYKETLRYL